MGKFNKVSQIAQGISILLLGDKLTAKLQYFRHRKKWPNFTHPADLSERLLSARFKPDFDKFAPYADKILVRDYVKSKGLGHLLLKHYGFWDKPEDIDFESLPDKFILKANNGCGNHYVCTDKNKLEFKEVIATLNHSLASGLNSKERHYRAIVPKVLCEELLETPDGSAITDYKLLCINGEPSHFLIITERDVHKRCCAVDENWVEIPHYIRPDLRPTKVPAPPHNLQQMVKYARILSADFECVRVDFYEHNNKVYFGELTFSPTGGFMYSYTDEAIKELGKKFTDE